MSDDGNSVPLPDLDGTGDVAPPGETLPSTDYDDSSVNRGAADLEAMFDVPVQKSSRPNAKAKGKRPCVC